LQNFLSSDTLQTFGLYLQWC